MAVQTRSVLKTYFETGDKPTATQFGDLIDSIFAAKHDIITNTAAVITAAASTVYAITTTASAVIDTNAIENGESFVVNRGTSQAAANAQVTFRHSNLIYYANGYADVQATNGSVDCMMSYAALMATDWILLVNRALYDESFA